MTNEKQYFTKIEAVQLIKEYILNNFDDDEVIDSENIHRGVFNTDYYIFGGACEAKQALEQYGVFDAIEVIQNEVVPSGENEMFGSIDADFADSVRFANMLWYVIGEQTINELQIDGLYVNEAMEEIEQTLEDLK